MRMSTQVGVGRQAINDKVLDDADTLHTATYRDQDRLRDFRATNPGFGKIYSSQGFAHTVRCVGKL